MAANADMVRAWEQVARTAQQMAADGLVVGTAGNVSTRVGDLVVVTPSGVRYDRLRRSDWVVVDLDGKQVHGTLRPTSELPMHLAVYRNTDARAVVHTHSVHATAASTLVDELPAIHYVAAGLGGTIRVAPYATYGSEELAEVMLLALRDRTACLLKNHGTITVAEDLDSAYGKTEVLEWLCQVWLAARAAGTPSVLPGYEIEHVVERIRNTYGQPR
ncbi:fuculose phosphate aldolase [Wenjunlia vitaminophila]|uniref:Fuculose phosphate aldolase n=1 Tax=Wenjunlia vitaminophila TaxID=76728 RepID=A0A0T6LT78_WENVI|nr:class II aldolase/adducin family protein [Wenjunlia vitaminophila]KRV49291.1 fuculose phosphate aldolase [Wenjunlia vitaminophila]